MIAYGLSDKGRVRATNQDAFDIYIDDRAAIVVVCDGMGGANAGNVASRFAIEAFMKTVRERLSFAADVKTVGNLLVEAAQTANQTVYSLGNMQPEFQGMGTTLVAAVALGEDIVIVNVGDSRAYSILQGQAKRLTEDHSYVEEMLRNGQISEEDARIHPQKNLITRAIGVDENVNCDIYTTKLMKDEILLLCSDGLSGMVRDERIAAIACGESGIERAAQCLIDEALVSGGTDNITAVLMKQEIRAEE